jgi:hypothetical protein
MALQLVRIQVRSASRMLVGRAGRNPYKVVDSFSTFTPAHSLSVQALKQICSPSSPSLSLRCSLQARPERPMCIGALIVFFSQTLAAASPHNAPPPPPSSPQCCKSVGSSTSVAAPAVAGRLGIDLTGLNVPIGLSCSPITVVGNNWDIISRCSSPTQSIHYRRHHCHLRRSPEAVEFVAVLFFVLTPSVFASRWSHRDQLPPHYSAS